MCKIPFLLTSILSDGCLPTSWLSLVCRTSARATRSRRHVSRRVGIPDAPACRSAGGSGVPCGRRRGLDSPRRHRPPLRCPFAPLRISPKDNLPGCVRWTQGPVVWEVPQAGYEYKRNNVVVVCDVTRSYPTFSRDFSLRLQIAPSTRFTVDSQRFSECNVGLLLVA